MKNDSFFNEKSSLLANFHISHIVRLYDSARNHFCQLSKGLADYVVTVFASRKIDITAYSKQETIFCP